jgi:hypothetical protein
MNQPQLPPRNWVSVDAETTRLATDEEYAEYLSIVISQEGLTILPTEPPAPLVEPNETPAADA